MFLRQGFQRLIWFLIGNSGEDKLGNIYWAFKPWEHFEHVLNKSAVKCLNVVEPLVQSAETILTLETVSVKMWFC